MTCILCDYTHLQFYFFRLFSFIYLFFLFCCSCLSFFFQVQWGVVAAATAAMVVSKLISGLKSKPPRLRHIHWVCYIIFSFDISITDITSERVSLDEWCERLRVQFIWFPLHFNADKSKRNSLKSFHVEEIARI